MHLRLLLFEEFQGHFLLGCPERNLDRAVLLRQ